MRGFEFTHETIRDWEERFLPYFTEQTSTQVVVIIDGAGQDRTQTSRVPLMTTVAFHHQAAIAPCPSFIIFDWDHTETQLSRKATMPTEQYHSLENREAISKQLRSGKSIELATPQPAQYCCLNAICLNISPYA